MHGKLSLADSLRLTTELPQINVQKGPETPFHKYAKKNSYSLSCCYYYNHLNMSPIPMHCYTTFFHIFKPNKNICRSIFGFLLIKTKDAVNLSC